MKLREYGTRGPAVALLHGFPGGAADWAPVAERLSRTHRVLVPDLLGFGASPRPTSHGELWVDAQARALLEALTRSGAERFALVGHDYGGPVALETFRRAPRRVTHLALSATNALDDTPIPFPLSLVAVPLVGDAAARVLFSRVALAAMARRSTAHDVRAARNDAGEARTVRTIFATGLRRLPELWGPVAAILPRVGVPALVIWGDRDPFFAVEQGRRTAERMPGARFVVYKRTGHFPHLENPQRFERDLQDLLRIETGDAGALGTGAASSARGRS